MQLHKFWDMVEIQTRVVKYTRACKNKHRKARQNSLPFSSKMLLKKIIVHILQQRKPESHHDMDIVLYTDCSYIFTSKSLNTLGDRAFCVAAPALWNSLPYPVWIYTYLITLSSQLKRFCFAKLLSNVP